MLSSLLLILLIVLLEEPLEPFLIKEDKSLSYALSYLKLLIWENDGLSLPTRCNKVLAADPKELLVNGWTKSPRLAIDTVVR